MMEAGAPSDVQAGMLERLAAHPELCLPDATQRGADATTDGALESLRRGVLHRCHPCSNLGGQIDASARGCAGDRIDLTECARQIAALHADLAGFLRQVSGPLRTLLSGQWTELRAQLHSGGPADLTLRAVTRALSMARCSPPRIWAR